MKNDLSLKIFPGLFILFLQASTLSRAEDVEIVAFYPWPQGVYQQLATSNTTQLAANDGGFVFVGGSDQTTLPAWANAPNGSAPTKIALESGNFVAASDSKIVVNGRLITERRQTSGQGNPGPSRGAGQLWLDCGANAC